MTAPRNRRGFDGSATWITFGVVAVVLPASLVLPSNFNTAPLNAVAVAACAFLGRRRLLWIVAGVLVLATFLAIPLGAPPAGPDPGLWILWANRTLAALATVAAAAIVDQWILTQRVLAAEHRAVERRNRELDALNQALGAREEKIANQNRELDRQGDQLERQAGALSHTAAELAGREQVLAQLLELSRALAGDLTQRDVMARICDALSHVLSPRAQAAGIFVTEQAAARLACHAGLGDDHRGMPPVPLAQAFAGILIARRQVAFLDDVAVRPDLVLPEASDGTRFRSVLGAPIWVQGQVVATLEAYATAPTAWADHEVGLVASLAAQASISLQAARLFEEVANGRRRFETVFRTLPVAVLVADDPEFTRVTGNPAAAALFCVPHDVDFSPFARDGRLARHEIRRDGTTLHPAERPLVRAVRGNTEVHGEELELRLPDGRSVAMLASAAPIHDARGAVRGGIAAFADVSALKRLERELEARRREAEESSIRKTRFLAAVSHDIRTPANAIRLQAELLRRASTDATLADRTARLTAELQASASALVELVSELLDLNHLDTGGLTLQEQDFALAAALRDACAHLAPMADAKGIALHCDAADGSLWLHADRIKLTRVLANLMENALKFTTAGAVRVTARRLGDGRVAIDVTDTGTGIPPEHLPWIFDEFFQLRNPERDRAKGRGLGLAICRRLVEAMGGTIEVESTLGRGSRFSVMVPASAVRSAPAVPVEAAHEGRARARLAGLRVLIAEDDGGTRTALAELLRAEGAEVQEAGDGLEALECLRATPPAALLLDLMMPRLEGTEVLRRLGGRRPPGLHRILVVTGDPASRDLGELTRLGADGVLAKPIDPAQVVRLLLPGDPA